MGDASGPRSPDLCCVQYRCGHCRSMAKDWETLSDEWKDHAVGLIAEVDCTADDGLPLCEDFEVQVSFERVILFLSMYMPI